jgi:sterol desaturase/sphingolipid hydroxylase (fatty acid hydroxylase superfamily)
VSALINALSTLSVLIGAAWLAWQLERWRPIDASVTASRVLAEWRVTGLTIVLVRLSAPLTAICSTTIISFFGGGLIHLPTDGGWYFASLLVLVLAFDLYKYAMHRLSHAVPFLWAMHSFHHSAEAISLLTGARHHWLEQAMNNAFLPVLAIIFIFPPDMAGIISFIFLLPDGCSHLNLRFPMGRAITWINSPQWHRIHHSVQPEHQNKNFAALLPLWDFVFGTAWIPAPDEYPRTGLVPSEVPSLMVAAIWPFRNQLRRLLASLRGRDLAKLRV